MKTCSVLVMGLALAIALGAPRAAAADQQINKTDDSWTTTWQSGDDKSFAYGIVDPTERTSFTFGQNADFSSVDITRNEGKRVVWARMGSKRYLIDDPQTFREARAIVDPIAQLGREQGKLGSLQGSLGHEQGKVGHEQGKIGHEQGKLGAKQAQLGAQQGAASIDDDEETADRLQAEQEAIGDKQSELGRQQSNLGHHQATMGEVQADLGRRQAELGDKQRELQPGVNANMKKLLQQTIKDGRARRI